MGLGSTAKKLQTVAELAEKAYTRVEETREAVRTLEASTTETAARVERLEADLAEQRALVEALAEAQGVDVDEVAAEVDPPAAPETESAGATGGDDGGTDVEVR